MSQFELIVGRFCFVLFFVVLASSIVYMRRTASFYWEKYWSHTIISSLLLSAIISIATYLFAVLFYSLFLNH